MNAKMTRMTSVETCVTHDHLRNTVILLCLERCGRAQGWLSRHLNYLIYLGHTSILAQLGSPGIFE